MNPRSRRQFILGSAGLAAVAGLSVSFAQETAPPPPGVKKAPAKPPALTPEKIQAVVGQSHRNLDAVRALVEEIPLLVNACWDWGGGDFETPLEAAAHTGRREIAEYLLAHHARPSLYASAMLGHLDTIKAALALNAKAYEVPGPHGFTLLHCAKQGGASAKAVYDLLVAQGAPETAMRPLPYVWPAGTKPTP
ncbi:MAG TPA: hypothetical protein VM029_10555 [Opitutaceae bacterium]|nr:hypothetical protein [Opitutaceae bacterium]